MEALKLNETEHKVYEELFQTCDLGKTAKIPKLIVGELLASSALPTDVLLKVCLRNSHAYYTTNILNH